jgi:hypothetical protein
MVLIGVILVVQGIAAGVVLRIVVGVLFAAAGAGRLYVETRR